MPLVVILEERTISPDSDEGYSGPSIILVPTGVTYYSHDLPAGYHGLNIGKFFKRIFHPGGIKRLFRKIRKLKVGRFLKKALPFIALPAAAIALPAVGAGALVAKGIAAAKTVLPLALKGGAALAAKGIAAVKTALPIALKAAGTALAARVTAGVPAVGATPADMTVPEPVPGPAYYSEIPMPVRIPAMPTYPTTPVSAAMVSRVPPVRAAMMPRVPSIAKELKPYTPLLLGGGALILLVALLRR